MKKDLNNTGLQWIVMLPFSGGSAQILLTNLENGNLTNVDALVMIANDMVISDNLLEKPLIIT